MKISYAQSLQSLTNKSFTIYGEDLDNIVWHDGNADNITKEQILEKQTELQAIEDALPENLNASNGKQKLKDLGLTDAEIKALIG
jgi:hypothetical protein